MTQVLTGQQNLQDLWREVIIDDGSGQPAVLTTTTVPAPSLLVVGAYEATFVNDVALTPAETTYTLTPFTDEVLVNVSEDVSVLLQDYTATVSDLVFHEEAVTVVRVIPMPVPPIFDAVTTTESITVLSEGVNPPTAMFEATTTSESVTMQGPVSPALTTESATTTENTTVQMLGANPPGVFEAVTIDDTNGLGVAIA